MHMMCLLKKYVRINLLHDFFFWNWHLLIQCLSLSLTKNMTTIGKYTQCHMHDKFFHDKVFHEIYFVTYKNKVSNVI